MKTKKAGMIKVKKKINQNVIKVINTDKTNRFSVMKPNTYSNSMKEHHEHDETIDKKEVNKIERNLNFHSKSITKMFKIGESHGQFKRALNNATVHVNGQLPILSGQEKDHKNSDTIKMRPTVNSMDGPKKNISDNYSDILVGIVKARDKGVLCSSTEELLESFEENNSKREKASKSAGERVIGSMDAVSLFTKLEANRSADIVREETLKSKIKFQNVDTHEIGIYLRKNMSNEETKRKDLEHILPKCCKVKGG